MFQTGSDDLFLPAYQDEELVNNLLSGEEPDGDASLARALLPLVESPSPPPLPWVCSTRYKTELCTSYSSSGFCKYAERCQFAHGLHELHVPFRHPKYKTELCRSYHTGGYCYYGSRCLFVHSPAEQRPTLRRRRNVPCRTFRSFGVCPFGTRCNFLHLEAGGGGGGSRGGGSVGSPSAGEQSPPPHPQLPSREWKPRGALCRTFSAFGFCLYGTRCRFQHGLPSKIKTSDQNPGGPLYPQPACSGLPSPAASLTSNSPKSSTSSSPPSTSPLATPSAEGTAHNAFTFSSQHLSDLLLPLALHLQQLESSKAQEIWDNRVL